MLKHDAIFRSGLFKFSAYVLHDIDLIKHVLQDNNRNYVKNDKYSFLILLGNGLFTSDGEPWLKQRRMIQPLFHQKSIVHSMEIMISEALKFVHTIREEVDITDEMGKLTLNIVGKSLIGAEDTEQTIGVIREELIKCQRTGSVLLKLPLSRYPEWLTNTVFLRKFKRSMDTLDSIVTNIIERHKTDTERINMLALLLSAGMTDNKQIKDEVMTLLLVGHETTMLALTWTFYLLSQHENIKQKLYEEINAGIGRPENITYEGLKKLTFLDCVVNESMRLYPPAYVFGRKSVDEDWLGEYYVPKNTDIVINVWGLHRNPKYWAEADTFDPSRFEGVDASKMPFIPFGIGPRMCIGAAFAFLEIKVILTAFLLAYDFSVVNTTVYPHPLITLTSNQNIRLRLFKRNNL
ncbi:cytochrome P450 [Dinghuibacter silviterrae]|uniref:Cytochrome P450 n=2 Tax=Dinghuibacter silviterrae TaxID=1539049 RepID=A0A4R8DV80_9BACT|nr:cytochrome P450 [Dinghuibacter silviterrae]